MRAGEAEDVLLVASEHNHGLYSTATNIIAISALLLLLTRRLLQRTASVF